MTGPGLVGVVGAFGGVGSAAVAQLRAWDVGPLRLGTRDPARTDGGVSDAEVAAVDVDDAASLAAFCAGCRTVVNCAGPSVRVGDRVARAAAAAAADYVDSGGDEALHGLLARAGGVPAGRVALLSAGMLPGISALLPRALAEQSDGAPTRLTAYAGGVGRFTHGAAVDYLATVSADAGTPRAAWRDGVAVPRAAAPMRDVELPCFPGRVTAQPYLSAELERVARALSLREATWYTVLDGRYVPAALERRLPPDDPAALEEGARALMRAAELDRFGRESYQRFVVELDDRTLLLHADDPCTLTGAMTALATRAVVGGEVPPGLGFAGEALDPGAGLEALRTATTVVSLDVVDAPLISGGTVVEEGVL